MYVTTPDGNTKKIKQGDHLQLFFYKGKESKKIYWCNGVAFVSDEGEWKLQGNEQVWNIVTDDGYRWDVKRAKTRRSTPEKQWVSGVIGQEINGSVKLWINDFNIWQTVPVHSAMPKWMKTPGTPFRARVTCSQGKLVNLNDSDTWCEFYQLG